MYFLPILVQLGSEERGGGETLELASSYSDSKHATRNDEKDTHPLLIRKLKKEKRTGKQMLCILMKQMGPRKISAEHIQRAV